MEQKHYRFFTYPHGVRFVSIPRREQKEKVFGLLRDGCLFINHHHHYRIGLPTIHFRHPNLTQFCLSCELCLLRCFGYLGTVTFNSDSHNPITLHFRIAYSHNPSLHFHNPIELPQHHHRIPLPPFDILDFKFAVFLFPRVFRLLRDKSPSSWYLHQDHRHSSSTRMVTSISSWYRGIPPLYIPLQLH